MKNTYTDLIEQSYQFPQEGFDLNNEHLTFHGVSIKYLIEKYGTPFKLIYLPSIGDQIQKARNLFNQAIEKYNYQRNYHFCYCTKCNHFYHVVNEAMKHQVNLETSSSFDIDLIMKFYREGKLDEKCIILHNGYKTDEYLRKILELNALGFENSVIILDSTNELQRIEAISSTSTQKIKIGLRMAINEEAQSAYHTSRLGIPQKEMLDFFQNRIKGNETFELKMLHFFVDSGIKDTLYYWGEFQRALSVYIEMKKESSTLTSFNLGGGFPIRNHLGFEYDYEYIINEIVSNIKEACTQEGVEEPHIFTEFGKYTVGESSAIIFEVLEQKQQNDTEAWYIINNSLMNTIPDAWSIHEKFILLPINKWGSGYQRVNIGGISCDHSDYYNSEDFNQEILLPKYPKEDKEPLYLGFFHTGAYQDAISGYGGIKHCLIPSPKHVIIDRDENGNLIDYVYREEQSVEEMFKILGY
jgi:arginine decarboxylase